MTPGITNMNSGSSFRYPAKMVPARACSWSWAASTRCTMNWSVHQYQIPRIGAPNRIPVQGKSGSDIGFHRSMNAGATLCCMASHPPNADRPRTVTAIEPPTSTNICRRSVYRTARRPPKTVYTPVTTTTTRAPVQKSMPMRASKTMPPAAMVTEILVST